jgi:hypothetical protein
MHQGFCSQQGYFQRVFLKLPNLAGKSLRQTSVFGKQLCSAKHFV